MVELSNISFKTITTPDDAQKLWMEFSPNTNIFDTWELRSLVHKYYQNELYFIVGFVEQETIGVLPLQFKKDEPILEFFGGTYMEDNKVLIKPGYEKYIPSFYQAIDKPARLEYILGQENFTESLPVLDYKYILPLDNIKSCDDFFQQYYDSEKRGKMRRKIKKINKEKINVTVNDFANFEMLIDCSLNNFGEQSMFNTRPHFKDIFRELKNLPFPIFFNSFFINDKLEAVSLAILYNGYYEYFNLGVNKNIKDISTFVHAHNLDQAIQSGAKIFDPFVGNYGWKELWKFHKIPQHIFSNIK